MGKVKTVNLSKIYGNGDEAVIALNKVNIDVSEGEFIVVFGSSGSGKSTLLHMLGGLDTPTDGEVFIDNISLLKLSDDEKTIFRRRNVGFIFQSFNLIPILTVYENVILPLELDGAKVDSEYINDILRTLGLENRKLSLPSELSGGQQQRVAIARALSIKPSIILADEPTGNLDTKSEMEVLGLLQHSAKKYNQTIIMITHNEDVAQLAHRVIRIENGEVV
ncbi:MAG: ABC transporter ATP-binding protein [Clostridium sp.]